MYNLEHQEKKQIRVIASQHKTSPKQNIVFSDNRNNPIQRFGLIEGLTIGLLAVGILGLIAIIKLCCDCYANRKSKRIEKAKYETVKQILDKHIKTNMHELELDIADAEDAASFDSKCKKYHTIYLTSSTIDGIEKDQKLNDSFTEFITFLSDDPDPLRGCQSLNDAKLKFIGLLEDLCINIGMAFSDVLS